MKAESLLSLRGVAVRYGNATAVAGVDLDLRAGEMVALLGSNGAGKSTIASAISGLVRPSRGTVWLDGIDVTSWPAHRRARHGVAHVPELRGIFPTLSVLDNLKAGVLRLPRRKRGEVLDLAFTIFPILASRQGQTAGTLSGGERQMLSLARVLSCPPRVLVADEMSLGLAPLLVSEVFDGLRRAREAGAAVLLVEQFVDRAVALADRAVILRRGTVAWQGPASAASREVLGNYLGTGAQLKTSPALGVEVSG